MTIRKELFKATNKITSFFGYELQLRQSDKDKEEQFLFLNYLRTHQETYSQIYQDLFVQYTLQNKSHGYFVEFGATNGITLSNTFLLEKNHAWTGILAEPARCWHADLFINRKCITDKRCVWSKTGESFLFEENINAPELSTLDRFSSSHRDINEKIDTYDVATITLNDLLATHHAPANIDYMSVDTEGSEYEILKNVDFNKWNIKIITVEHNYQLEKRKKIHYLLEKNGYERKFMQFSRWDDWYVKKQ